MNQSNINIDSDYSSIDVNKTAKTSTLIMPCTSFNDQDNNKLLSMASAAKNVTSSLCQDCRVHRPVFSPQKLIARDGQ
ncbi:unnamed protein product [Rotaria sp. Silwood2]|nr:unnamed protein product [Rotaria sp. Silwood2]CAF2876943.1 unnamed protein product [Rotaria sp. Silwood2]CAF3255707.1 unnamed protein product [Rotaria sp. Silwood2]